MNITIYSCFSISCVACKIHPRLRASNKVDGLLFFYVTLLLCNSVFSLLTSDCPTAAPFD